MLFTLVDICGCRERGIQHNGRGLTVGKDLPPYLWCLNPEVFNIFSFIVVESTAVCGLGTQWPLNHVVGGGVGVCGAGQVAFILLSHGCGDCSEV